MTLGSIVRTTDSGLSCPDWAMCFGKLIPIMDMQIFLEWFHRLIALFLGILLCFMGWKVLRTPQLWKIFSKELALAFVLFTWQCILGGLTVLKLLDPSIVSSHLLTALLFFSLLLWIWRRSHSLISEKPLIENSSEFTKWGLWIAAVCIYLQLGVGGMVSSNNAGLICPDFPTCHGSWTGTQNFLTMIQMTHRYFAFVLFGFSIVLFVKSRRETNPFAQFAIRVFPLFLSLQILLGVLNIFFAMPLWARVAHHANGIFIFATVLLGGIDLLLASKRQRKRVMPFTVTKEAAL
jgi:cytochrome c oxidase assembly protein subunit 15